jgi:hypothetical protein
MINFSLHQLFVYLTILSDEHLSSFRRSNDDINSQIQEDDRKRIADLLEPIYKFCIENGAQSAVNQIEHMIKCLRYSTMFYFDLLKEIDVLSRNLRDDLRYERFYHYPKAKGLMVLNYTADWQAALRAFPSTEDDIKGAVDCYALDHPRGSIYHCMMVLERGLPALAKRLKVQIRTNRDSWGPIIENIKKEIDNRQRLLAHPPRGSPPPTSRAAKTERALLEKCSDAAMEFRYFADVWRNHIAHGRGAYDENDAKKVLDHVRSYMDIIATKIGLGGRR